MNYDKESNFGYTLMIDYPEYLQLLQRDLLFLSKKSEFTKLVHAFYHNKDIYVEWDY